MDRPTKGHLGHTKRVKRKKKTIARQEDRRVAEPHQEKKVKNMHMGPLGPHATVDNHFNQINKIIGDTLSLS